MIMKYTTAPFLLTLSAIATQAQDIPESVVDAPNYISESKHFRLYCHARDHDCGAASDPAVAQLSRDLLDRAEAAYTWLDDLGFPVEDSVLERASSDGKFLLRLDPRDPKDGGCSAVACTDISRADFRIFIPMSNSEEPTSKLDHVSNLAGVVKDPSTLAHEFVHTLQNAIGLRNPQKEGKEREEGEHIHTHTELFWMNEATATAIGTSFGTRYGWDIGLYEPNYYMSFDRPFYNVVSTGYGNWAYLLGVGGELGSRAAVAYLAKPEFLEIEKDFHGEPPSALMELLYNSDLVEDRTFDREFPKFVAKMNNIEPANEPGKSAYHYYSDIEEHTFSIPTTDEVQTERFNGSALTYAVAPMRMKLKVEPEPDAGPRDTLMMVDLEVTSGTPLEDLTLINEHKRADKPLHETLMLDGSAPPDELGFIRVVNAPSAAQGDAVPNEFELRIRARPISLDPPNCFQAGEPAVFGARGFDPAEGRNWRLVTDNGTTDGLSVTPARAGDMTVTLEIDSPVTRGETGLDPVEPAKTQVELGHFEVAENDCMVRLTMGPAQVTYTADGTYTEYLSPEGEALYFKENDIAAHNQGKWMPIPPQAKQMMVARMSGNSLMGVLSESPLSGEAEGEAVFPVLPLEFSKRFSWQNIRKAIRHTGETPQRRTTSCPDGEDGCTEITFRMGSHPIPIVFDAQDRPVRVTFQGQPVIFAYGTWPIRRPPGW